MKTSYITPVLFEIAIDKQVSLNLGSLATEADNGIDGNASKWTRTTLYQNDLNNDLNNDLWQQ